MLRVTFSGNENGPGACTGGMVEGSPGIEVLDAAVDPAALACPRVPTGESNGAVVAVGAGAGAAVVGAVAVELTAVEAVVEGVGVEAGKVVTGGPALGAAVVPDAGVAAAVEVEAEDAA